MTTTTVPNLVTQYNVIPTGQMVVFPADRHRTFFAIQDREATDIHIWVGTTPPPVDTDQWFSIGGTDSIDILHLPSGLYGPIYVTESSAGDGEMTVLSALHEQPTTEDLPS